ncbi:MAG: PorP/SprF family type IX secretion system membrane protein [Crocinitomicaceae bacterium]
MKKSILLFSVFSMLSFSAFSQTEAIFSTDGFAPFWSNPASTGSFNKFSANAIYRNQWPSIPGNFNTYGFTVEADTKIGFKSTEQKLNIPIGLNAVFTQFGNFNTQTIAVPFSFPFKLRNSTLAIGVSAGVKRAGFIEGMSFYSGAAASASVTKLNLNAGVFWSGKNYYLGFSSTNLTAPIFDIINYKLKRQYNWQAGYRFKVGKHHIYPMLIGASDLITTNLRLITYFQFKEDIFSFGAGFSPRYDYYLGGTVRLKQFKLGYMYDLTTSKLTNASGGSHEFRLSYTIAK